MNNRTINRAITVLLIICALVTTGFAVRSQLTDRSLASQPSERPTYFKNWQSLMRAGSRIGSEQAPIQIIEFADFECPYCAQFKDTYASLKRRYRGKISLTFIHFPLPMHRFAVLAGNAAECAGEQGKFIQMHDALLDGQQNFGIDSWQNYASRAGVTNLDAFESCMTRTSINPRVQMGQRLARRLNISGTPTILVNGWKVSARTEQQLAQTIDQIVSGGTPST